MKMMQVHVYRMINGERYLRHLHSEILCMCTISLYLVEDRQRKLSHSTRLENSESENDIRIL